MDKIKFDFNCDNKWIQIKIIAEDYCSLYVKNDQKEVCLGSYPYDKLKKVLIEKLKSPATQEKTIFKGINIFHITYLEGPHATISASIENNGDIILYWLDENFKFSKILILTEPDLTRLVTALENLDEIDDLFK